MHHDLSCSDSSSLKRKGLEVCREDTPRPRIAWDRGNMLGKDPRLGKYKIVLLLLAVVTDPIILLVRKLHFFVFGILTLLCWSVWVRAEFFYSSILICMFHSLQLCSLKDIKATLKSDGILFPSELWEDFPSYLCFPMRHLPIFAVCFQYCLGVVFKWCLEMCASCIFSQANAPVRECLPCRDTSWQCSSVLFWGG